MNSRCPDVQTSLADRDRSCSSIAAAAFLLIAPVRTRAGQVLGSISMGDRRTPRVRRRRSGASTPARAVTDSSGTSCCGASLPVTAPRASRFDHSLTEVEVIVPVGGVSPTFLSASGRSSAPSLRSVRRVRARGHRQRRSPNSTHGRQGPRVDARPRRTDRRRADRRAAGVSRSTRRTRSSSRLARRPEARTRRRAGLHTLPHRGADRPSSPTRSARPTSTRGRVAEVRRRALLRLGLETRAAEVGINASGSPDWLDDDHRGAVAGFLLLASGRAVHVGATGGCGPSFPYGYADASGAST